MTATRNLIASLVAVILVLSACSTGDATPPAESIPPPPAPTDETKLVVVDYSPTVSDVGALLYLLSDPIAEVVAITVPPTGEAGCEAGIDVTLGILELLHQPDIPVACGNADTSSAKPWASEFAIDPLIFLSGLPEHDRTRDPRPAHDLIIDVVAQADRPVSLYAVAPLTNIAEIAVQSPATMQALEIVVIMGGAVDVPGNVPGTDAEWNFWIDAPAAAGVLAADANLFLVPLDATNDVPVAGLWPETLRLAPQTAAVEYLTGIVESVPSSSRLGYYYWDELAAAIVTGDDLVRTATDTLNFELAEGPDHGRTVVAGDGAAMVIAGGVPDPGAFVSEFLSVLGGAPAEPIRTHRYDMASPPSSPAVLPHEVLAHWLLSALNGDVSEARSSTSPDTEWAGPGATPEAFVDGSRPFESTNITISCQSVLATAECAAEWNDLWLDGIPEIEAGFLRVKGQVDDGRISAFEFLDFDPSIPAAFLGHLSWLETSMPTSYEQDCTPDPTVASCSALLVATAADWSASR